MKKNKVTLLRKEDVDKVLNEGVREIDRRLRMNLCEELGISDETKRFVDDVCRYAHTNRKVLFGVQNGETVSDSFGFYEKKVSVVFRIYKCKDRTEEKELILTNDLAANADSIFRYKGLLAEIHVPVVFVDGKMDMLKFSDDLQHEANHIYQQLRSGEQYKVSEYEFAKDYLYSGNVCERCLATIIYLCNPTEQDSFVNGMYGYVMKALDKVEYPIDKSNISAYAELQNLYKAYDFLQRNRDVDEMKTAIEKFNAKGITWNVKKYLTRASEGIKEFERKIKRTLTKCEKDAVILGYSIRSRGPVSWLF